MLEGEGEGRGGREEEAERARLSSQQSSDCEATIKWKLSFESKKMKTYTHIYTCMWMFTADLLSEMKSVTEGHTLQDAVSTACLEQANLGTESRLRVAEGGDGEWLLVGMGFLFGVMKCSKTVVWAAQHWMHPNCWLARSQRVGFIDRT